jgi:hypothetical protein
MGPPVWGLWNSQVGRNRKLEQWFTRLRRRGKGSVFLMGMKFQFYKLKNFQKLVGCTAMSVYLALLNCSFKNG